jgi:hypothetical protein
MKESQEEKLRFLARQAQYSRAKYMAEQPMPHVPPYLNQAEENEGNSDNEMSEPDLTPDGNEHDTEAEFPDGTMELESPEPETDEEEEDEEVDWDLDERINPHLYSPEIVPSTP